VPLVEGTDCRFGLCLRDELQGSGLAQLLMPPTIETARRFGIQRLILRGGVHAQNERARGFYIRQGFRETGRFTNQDGVGCVDMLLDLPESKIG